MKCLKCNKILDREDVFCPVCGTKLQCTCSSCGAITYPGDSFCRKCGKRLKDDGGIISAEFQSQRTEFIASQEPLNTISFNERIFELKRQLSVQTELSKAVAHKINNFLSIILTSCQLAVHNLSRSTTNQDLQEFLQNIIDSSDLGGKIIHEFQKFLSAIEESMSPDEVAKLASEIMENLKLDHEEGRNYQIDVDDMTSGKSTFPGLQDLSILIIDDEERVRHTLSYALTLAGCHVITASSGFEGVELAKKRDYDIAFIDLKMPNMDGLETARQIKELSPETFTILMTGWNVKLEADRSKRMNIDALLKKPFQLSEIRKIIDSIIR